MIIESVLESIINVCKNQYAICTKISTQCVQKMYTWEETNEWQLQLTLENRMSVSADREGKNENGKNDSFDARRGRELC